MKAMTVKTVLTEAARFVDEQNEEVYGHPFDDFTAVTKAAEALGVDPMLEGPKHHALYMMLLKIQRLVQTPDHYDSIVDIAGYARTYERVLDIEKAEDIGRD